MSLLDRVAWGEVFGDLLSASPRAVRTAAMHCVNRSPFLGLAPMTFAVLVAQMPRRLLWDAIRAHSDGVDPLTIGWWLDDVAHIAIAATQPPRTPPAFPAGRVADIDADLAGLPLLSAVTEHAAATAGRIGVYLADLGPAIAGRCNPGAVVLVDDRPATAIIIELAPGHTRRTWLHELGHAFDPDRDTRTPEELEVYADALAELLAHLPPDAPLSAVQPLAERAYAQVREAYARRATPIEHAAQPAPAPTARPGHLGAASTCEPTPPGPADEMPAPGLESLLAFAALPLVD